MSAPTKNVHGKKPGLAPEIAGLIAALRRKIRWHIVWDALLASVIWLGLTFWIGLALDYFPVLMWANELPYAVRFVGLLLISGVLALIIFRLLLRRIFVPLRDRSMALLIERQHREFADGLITTVEIPGTNDEYSEEMLAVTRQQAVSQLNNVQVGRLLQSRLLWKRAFWAVAFVLSVGGFAAVNAEAFETWVRRMYLLEDRPWPRSAKIEMIGIQVERISARTDEVAFDTIRNFDAETRSIKVAMGSNIQLQIAADSQAERIPDDCRLLYRLDDRTQGQLRIPKDGTPNEGKQIYLYRGRPFQAILGDIEFDVIGHDHRIRGYRIEAVESPVVTETKIVYVHPKYLDELQSEQDWLYSSSASYPAGTQLTLHMKTNKPIERITGYDTLTEKEFEITPADDQTSFEFAVGELLAPRTIEVTLYDSDGIISERPHQIHIGVTEDKPPEVEVVVAGIGNAITPNARLPIEGTIKDDNALQESWFEYKRGDEVAKVVFPVAQSSVENQALDFRDLRAAESPFELQPGQQLTVQVKASDRMDINGGPNIGKNEIVTLDVVSSDALIAILERREYAQRRTFEHILDELTQTRDTLIRLRESLAGRDVDVLEAAEGTLSDEAKAKIQGLRVLRTQQSLRQSEKSRQETIAVAESFYFLRQELINNRVDAEDRQQRLKEQIADPLLLTTIIQKNAEGEEVDGLPGSFQFLDQQLKKLAEQITGGETPTGEEAVQAANQLLAELNNVLESMLDIETYNELIEIVRSIIDDVDGVIEETRKQRRKNALDLLE